MVPTMIGTKILKRVRVNLFQGTKKLKMASLKESLRDYHRGLSNNWVNQTPRKVGIFTQISRRRWLPKTLGDIKRDLRLIPIFGKLLQNRKRKAIAVLFGCAIPIVVIALLPPTELSFNDSCQISGPIQKLKSSVQGKHYWAKQLQLLDEEVRYWEAQPERFKNVQQMAQKRVNEALAKNRQFMEEIYSKYPELRPSPHQTMADELRKQADAIEHAELLEKLEQLRTQRLMTLKSCRPVIIAATQ